MFSGQLDVVSGAITNSDITVLHAESVAEDITVTKGGEPFTGTIPVNNGKVKMSSEEISDQSLEINGISLIHSAALTTEAFKRSILGDWGQYIVAIGLLLFAFSTAISWSYYGGRAVTYLIGEKYVIYYKMIYIIGFFIAAFTDTTIVWNISYITIALMTIPSLLGLWILRKDIKNTVKEYWIDFHKQWPDEKIPVRQ